MTLKSAGFSCYGKVSEQKGSGLYLSQKAFVFGEQTSAVLHRDVQSSSVELYEGNTELKPDQTETRRTKVNLHLLYSACGL